jgi:hypothetical protein
MLEVHPWAFPEEGSLERLVRRVLDAGYRGRRFRHFPNEHVDKDRSYYRLDYDPSLLGPVTFAGLGSWEHFLLEAEDLPEWS